MSSERTTSLIEQANEIAGRLDENERAMRTHWTQIDAILKYERVRRRVRWTLGVVAVLLAVFQSIIIWDATSHRTWQITIVPHVVALVVALLLPIMVLVDLELSPYGWHRFSKSSDDLDRKDGAQRT